MKRRVFCDLKHSLSTASVHSSFPTVDEALPKAGSSKLTNRGRLLRRTSAFLIYSIFQPGNVCATTRLTRLSFLVSLSTPTRGSPPDIGLASRNIEKANLAVIRICTHQYQPRSPIRPRLLSNPLILTDIIASIIYIHDDDNQPPHANPRRIGCRRHSRLRTGMLEQQY